MSFLSVFRGPGAFVCGNMDLVSLCLMMMLLTSHRPIRAEKSK